MNTRIITNTEIKALLGIGSASDVLVELWNDAATEIVCSLLGMADIAKHQVTDERVELLSGYELILNDYPVDETTLVLKTTFDHTAITGFSFKKDPQKRRTVRVYDSGGTMPMPLPYECVFASYMGGYTAQDTLEVLSLTDLADKTINVKIAGVTTQWTLKASGATGNQINIGLTVAATATAIATALGGSAVGAVVTLPLGSTVTLGTATAVQLDVTNSDVPAALKNAVALIAGGGIAEKEKSGDIVSYTIGGKSVTFRNQQEASAAQTVLNNWLSTYKKTKIMGI